MQANIVATRLFHIQPARAARNTIVVESRSDSWETQNNELIDQERESELWMWRLQEIISKSRRDSIPYKTKQSLQSTTKSRKAPAGDHWLRW